MIRPHPTSTLFPYTTLFRSLGDGDRQPVRPRRLGDRRHRLGPPARQDRKSTRLNSSHLGISYAVFCLKKKKTNQVHSNQYDTERTYYPTSETKLVNTSITKS